MNHPRLENKKQCQACGAWITCRGRNRKELDAHLRSEHPDEYARQLAARREMGGGL